MQDIKLILALLGFLITIVIGLISYIIKTKDATEKATKEALKELTGLVSTITQNVTILKLELENNVHTTRRHEELISKHTDLLASIRITEATINGRMNAVEKDVVRLKKSETQ